MVSTIQVEVISTTKDVQRAQRGQRDHVEAGPISKLFLQLLGQYQRVPVEDGDEIGQDLKVERWRKRFTSRVPNAGRRREQPVAEPGLQEVVVGALLHLARIAQDGLENEQIYALGYSTLFFGNFRMQLSLSLTPNP